MPRKKTPTRSKRATKRPTRRRVLDADTGLVPLPRVEGNPAVRHPELRGST